MTVDTDVLIIGAGPAGLTASYLLTREGASFAADGRKPRVIVLERDPKLVGGISRTVDYKGFLFDIGGHRFFSKSKEVVDLWKEILPDDFIERPRISRIFYKGKLYSYPLKAFEALFNLGIFESALCMASYAYARMRPIPEPKTFHQWVRNQFGERLFSIFFKTYTEKVWGMSCDEISADWAAQRIKGLSLGGAVLNAFARTFRRKAAKAAPGAPVVKTLIESFQYPRRGPGMMWDAAARKTREGGGDVLMDRLLESMSYDADKAIWTVTARRGDGAVETYTARHVISSAPIRDLSQAIKPTPMSTFSARALKYRDFLTVAIITTRKDLFPDNWIYIHDPSVKVGRVQNFRSWSPEMVPDPELACLGLEYFCFEGDGVWSAPDEELVALAKKEIAQIGLVEEHEVIDACVVRQAKAYPVYDDDYKHHVNMVRMDLEKVYPTLHFVGRNGMHKYNNQDHAMMTAMLTVKNILAGERLFDIWDVNEDAEYHESGESGAQEALKSERLVPRRAA